MGSFVYTEEHNTCEFILFPSLYITFSPFDKQSELRKLILKCDVCSKIFKLSKTISDEYVVKRLVCRDDMIFMNSYSLCTMFQAC